MSMYEGAMFWLANTTLIDVNHHFCAFLGRTLHVSCVCVRVCVCVCDCVVFFVKGDFLKIRTQFAVKMLLCIIYIYFFFPPFRPLLRRCFGWKLLQ